MFYSEYKINFNESDDFISPSFLNNSLGNEVFFIPFSNEDTELNYPSLDIRSTLQNSEIHVINVPNQVPGEKKNLGRKTKDSAEIGQHNEFSEDNLIRKSKKVFKDAIFEFTNTKIEGLEFELDITIDNKEYKIERLLNLGQTITKKSSVEDNLALFKAPIKSIFYEISGKYKKYPKNYNIAVIEELCTNANCQEISNILNLDYLDCLKYYRRDEDALNNDYLGFLNGLQLKFDNLPNKLKKEGHDDSYEEALIYTIKNIEKIYYEKIPRERRKKDEL